MRQLIRVDTATDVVIWLPEDAVVYPPDERAG